MQVIESISNSFEWSGIIHHVVEMKCPYCERSNVVSLDKRTYFHDKAKITRATLFRVYIEETCSNCNKPYIWYMPKETYLKWKETSW